MDELPLGFRSNNRSNWDIEQDIKQSPLFPYCRNALGILSGQQIFSGEALKAKDPLFQMLGKDSPLALGRVLPATPRSSQIHSR